MASACGGPEAILVSEPWRQKIENARPLHLQHLLCMEIMHIRRLAFDGSRNSLFVCGALPSLESSDAKVLKALALVLTRHEDQLSLETLDLKFCDDQGPRLIRRENEVTVAQITQYRSRSNCWNPYYVGLFETQMLGTVLKGASVLHLLEKDALQLFFRRQKPVAVRLQQHHSASEPRSESKLYEAGWDLSEKLQQRYDEKNRGGELGLRGG